MEPTSRGVQAHAAPPTRVRRDQDAANRRTIILSAIVLMVAIIGGVTAVALLSDGDTGRDTAIETSAEGQPDAKPRSIPKPNEGRAPEDAGDRGGWAQLSLLVLIVASISGIGVKVVRGSKTSRQRRAAWLAAADADHDGALDPQR